MNSNALMSFSNSSALSSGYAHNTYSSLSAVQYGLVQSLDGSLAFNSKSPAYVLGEQLRNLVDKAIDISTPVFSKLGQAANAIDRLFSRALTIFPGASAEEITDVCTPMIKGECSVLKASEELPLLDSTSSAFLNWKDRPPELERCIDSAFNELTKTSQITWKYNGDWAQPNYICHVNEYNLMKKIIQESKDGRKDFYAIDIGSGEFEWANGFSNYINSQTDLPDDVTVHIIGVRGEDYIGEEITTRDRTKIYRLGKFKVEELSERFLEHGLDLTNKVDIITSKWCFTHLADPVGTFVQTYNLLRPKTGVLTTDGFAFIYPGIEDPRESIVNLFMTTKAPFVLEVGTYLEFLLQRPDNLPLQLPMKYTGLTSRASANIRNPIESGCVTKFDKIGEGLAPSTEIGSLKKFNYDYRTNNVEFYEQLIRNGILVPSNLQL